MIRPLSRYEIKVNNSIIFVQLASGRFRAGDLTAMEYVEIGMVIMGKSAFLRVLPDLLRTLPNGPTKQSLSEAQMTVMAI